MYIWDPSALAPRFTGCVGGAGVTPEQALGRETLPSTGVCAGAGGPMGHVLLVADRSCVHAQRLRLGCGCTGRGQGCRGREPDIPMGPSLTALGKPMEVARERLFWAILLPNCWFRLLSSSLKTLLSRKKTTGPVRGLGQRINP